MRKAKRRFESGLREIKSRETFAIQTMDFEEAVRDDLKKTGLQLRVAMSANLMEYAALRKVGEIYIEKNILRCP